MGTSDTGPYGPMVQQKIVQFLGPKWASTLRQRWRETCPTNGPPVRKMSCNQKPSGTPTWTRTSSQDFALKPKNGEALHNQQMAIARCPRGGRSLQFSCRSRRTRIPETRKIMGRKHQGGRLAWRLRSSWFKIGPTVRWLLGVTKGFQALVIHCGEHDSDKNAPLLFFTPRKS